MRTREWYRRRADQAEQLARNVMSRGNRERLLRMAHDFRLRAEADEGQPENGEAAAKANPRRPKPDLWHWP